MSWTARAAAGLLRAYQLGISPLLPRACRFEPSCSEFARQAVLRHGLSRGVWLALKRLGRCHPFHPGGYDPPPRSPSERARDTRTTWKSERSWLRS